MIQGVNSSGISMGTDIRSRRAVNNKLWQDGWETLAVPPGFSFHWGTPIVLPLPVNQILRETAVKTSQQHPSIHFTKQLINHNYLSYFFLLITI